MSSLTLENIADVAIEEGLTTADEVEVLLAEPRGLTADTTTVLALPRMVQAWGYRP